MNRIYLLAAILFIFFGTPAPLPAAEFAAVTEGRAWSFPRDHGAHPEFKTEWWYFTGHLQDATGRTFGFQWTVFRSALRPTGEKPREGASSWRADQVYLGHLAISDLHGKKFEYAESSARGALDLAGAEESGFRVWLPGFAAQSSQGSWTLKGKRGDLEVDLKMTPTMEPLLHGRGGFSPKSEEAGKASYYYSIPHIPVQGRLRIAGQNYSVQGDAWMDHEFGSGQLSSGQTGWDWMGLPLGGKASLMVYRLRGPSNSDHEFLSGTYVDPEGKPHFLGPQELQLKPSRFWKSPRSGGEYPLEWQVLIPSLQVDLQVQAAFPDQELDTSASTQVIYWEGSVSVEGNQGALKTKSRGYLEMTGYAQGFDKKI